jgi:homospermidine synthase
MEERIKKALTQENIIEFSGNILVIGYGTVSRCVLPVLLRTIKVNRQNITVIDMLDLSKEMEKIAAEGISFKQLKVTRENYKAIIDQFRPNLLIDLAWDIETYDIIEYCHEKKILFINTSLEEWDPYSLAHKKIQSFTLYSRQVEISNLIKKIKSDKNPSTAILDHGANPGMVSHFTKKALISIGKYLISYKQDSSIKSKYPNKMIEFIKPKINVKLIQGCIREAETNGDFSKLAQAVGLKVVHISERDTQITIKPKQPEEFVNTWSIPGFIEEGMATSELGWGTHEEKMPKNSFVHNIGEKNQICLPTRGMNTLCRSRTCSGEIIGYVIRHGEAFGISSRLSVYDEKNKECLYRPTVHYVYCCCDLGLASMHEFQMKQYKLQEQTRIMFDDIVSGRDELGCTLYGDFGVWWIGSMLDIHETRKLLPGYEMQINATSMQVAISLVSAIIWMIKNPTKGVLLPDDMDHSILEYMYPYLGPFKNGILNWSPYDHIDSIYTPRSGQKKIEISSVKKLWQFKDFLVSPKGCLDLD